MSSATPIIIIFGCAIIIAVVIVCLNAASRRKYKQRVDDVAGQTKPLSDALDELFKPDKRASQNDIDRFLSDNHKAINAAKEICEAKSKFNDLLKPSGIIEFVAKVDPINLQASLADNNTVYDAIAQLTALCIKPQLELEQLMAPDHYFAYSEMERFKNSLAEVEACEKRVFPKYAKYVTNDAVKQLKYLTGVI